MVYCPLCEGNGLIYKATIKVTGNVIYICDECDLTWKTADIFIDNCYTFEEIMSDLGKKALWSELTNIELLEQYFQFSMLLRLHMMPCVSL